MEKSNIEIFKDEGIKIKNYNPHPIVTKRNLNDCYIRALVKFLNMKYEDVYNELFEYAKEKYLQPNDPIVLRKFYINHELKRIKIPIEKRESIFDFILKNKDIDMIINERRHIFAYMGKTIYDYIYSDETQEEYINHCTKNNVFGYIIKK